MNELEEKFYETGVVPVVVLEDAEDAVPLAQALVEGGLLSAEGHFRTQKSSFAQCRGVHPPDDGGFSTDAGGSRHGAYEGAGRCGCSSRCKVYRKSGI